MVLHCKHAFRVVVDAEDDTSRPRLHALAYATVPGMLLVDDITALPQHTVYAVMHIETHAVVAAGKNSVAAGISAAAAAGGKKLVVAGKEMVVGAAGKVMAAVVGAAVYTVEEVDPNYWRGVRA